MRNHGGLNLGQTERTLSQTSRLFIDILCIAAVVIVRTINSRTKKRRRIITVDPATAELREIRDVHHIYNGLPAYSFLCLPGQKGADTKPLSVKKQVSESPTVNNQGGVSHFSLTGGGGYFCLVSL